MSAATPIRYTPDVEQPKPDEAETIDGIIAAMTEQAKSSPAVRITRSAPPMPKARASLSAS